jgi:hypothetical protein
LKPVPQLVNELEKLVQLAEENGLPVAQQWIVGHLRLWEKAEKRKAGKPHKARLPGSKRAFHVGDGDWELLE